MNLNSAELPHFVYLILLLTLLFSGVIFNSKLKTSELLKQAFWWLVIILVVLVLYSFRYELSFIKSRVTGELFPSKVVQIDERKIEIRIANDRHFYIDLLVNDEPVRFMIDTGASDIVLSASDARRVGIQSRDISSFRRYQTANGMVVKGIAKVDKIEISGLAFYDFNVAVSNTNIGTSLLGMSFLNRFEKYEFYQDRLVLTIR